MKECEFRFNIRGRDMYRFILRELRERPLNQASPIYIMAKIDLMWRRYGARYSRRMHRGCTPTYI